MTPAGLGRLRGAAALAHGSTSVGLRLRHQGGALLHVDRWTGPEASHPVPWMSPCAFRSAVAQAHADQRAGRTLAILGLPMSVDPAVDVCTAPGTQLHPGPLIRTLAGDAVTVAFATLLAAERVHAVVAACEGLGALARAEAHLHVDPLLEVTVVVVEQPCDVPARELQQGLAAVSDALVACSMETLLDALEPGGRTRPPLQRGPA